MKKIKKRRKLNIKKVVLFIIFIFIVIALIIGSFKIFISDKETLTKAVNISKYSFIQYGSVKNTTNIYTKEGNKYNEIGSIEKGFSLEFESLDNNYLKIKGFDNEYYIDIEYVNEKESIEEEDQRYKNYILFNENVVTNDITSFYNETGNLLYTINNSYNLPIIIKDDDRYGVEFNDSLVYIKNEDVKEIKNNNNTDKKNSSGVGVLNYHFFYDENDTEDTKGCNEEICVSKSQFKSELDYFKDNNILPIKAQELSWYIDGKVQLPKSVYITIDDGGRTQIAVDLLKEYQYYATIFLVTSWYVPKDYYTNEYIELHSHTDNMHNQGDCPGGQGGGIKCLPEETVLKDLKISREKLNGSTVIAYPFYEYNDYSIEMLKKSGFEMAFIGESSKSDNLVHVGSNKYTLPRFVMVNYTTKSDFDKYFGNIS